MHKYLWLLIHLCYLGVLQAQGYRVSGKVSDGKEGVAFAFIVVGQKECYSDSTGYFTIHHLSEQNYTASISAFGYHSREVQLNFKDSSSLYLDVVLVPSHHELEEVVVTGTMKEVSKSHSPVPVELYHRKFFLKNPSPGLFEAIQNVNGVRPQVNCNICNTGDIHINGLEGPYTMVMIDGMPLVSSLSTVYGLQGIPNAIVERIEVVKGPASTLYGSEAVAGLINVVTRNPQTAPTFYLDISSSTWNEHQLDAMAKNNFGRSWSVLTSASLFHFNTIKDINKDNFTDVSLQKRGSIFQKWQYRLKNNKNIHLASRYLWEDRWGGETNWKPEYRGGDLIYGESITTKRWEIIGSVPLPVKEKLHLSFSWNTHQQNSAYGTTLYLAKQHTGFTQLLWDKKKGRHDWLGGIALRYTMYVDNTPATNSTGDPARLGDQPQYTTLPGIFLQDEIKLNDHNQLLLGMRYDHHPIHGTILTPRLALKIDPGHDQAIRINMGTGFRVVNLFTEDHAALTGARDVVIPEILKPERSFNVNLNYTKKMYLSSGHYFSWDISAFYTRFSNRIIPDYTTDTRKIIYDNLNGYAESKGLTLNADASFRNGITIRAGCTVLNNLICENGDCQQAMLAERFSATWTFTAPIRKYGFTIDYTGNLYGPMMLPLAGQYDPRPQQSPLWSIQNINFTYLKIKRVQVYLGIKNIFNWVPSKHLPFLIARAHDPFDKNVVFDASGHAQKTVENPYGLTFDPSYVYASNQGIRFYLGARWEIPQ